MKKICTALILCFTMLFQFLPAFTVHAAAINFSRIGGSDRYATSVLISQKGWTQATTVIIATGLNYPDALAASSLSKSQNAPILLTGTDAMDQAVVAEIDRLNATKAILVGGTDVIGTGVETQLKSLGINSITRYGGADRYETSVKIGETVGVNNGIIVATGLNFPDALSIAPIAAMKSMPILLSPQNALDPYVSAFIANKSIPVSYIAGGSDVVSDAVASSVPNSTRLSGSDRYGTNISIINKFASSLNFDTVYLATGLNFPDALSGSALAAKNNAPIILTGVDTITQEAIDLIKSKGVKNVVILGGTDVVSQSVIDAITGQVSPTSVSLNKTSITLMEGETATLSATVLPVNATDKSVTWKSTNGNASVDNSGKITALSAGEATVTATTNVGNFTASCVINVTAPPVSATGNLAYGRIFTSSAGFEKPEIATDADRYSEKYSGSTGPGLQWVQIDLGDSYDVNYIRLQHYYNDGRTYHDVIVQVSNKEDFSSGVSTLFNNDNDNSAGLGQGSNDEYIETASGLDIATSVHNARYVRFYSNGNTVNNYNHYVEIEVYSEERRSTFNNASQFLNVPTYDGEDMSVHPSVVYFDTAWHGYHYWMVSTPYPYSNDDYENPEITASNDGINWVVPSGVTNPLAPMPAVGHNCDPELFYNKATDELWIYYLEANDIDKTYMKFLKSSNGTSWTSAKTLFTDSRSAYETISPTVDYIASKNLYYMWTVNLGNEALGQKDNYVELRTSSDGQNWSDPQTLSNFTQDEAEVWHIYIRYIPTYNEYWCVFAAYPDGSNVGDTELYYSKSVDGKNWTTYYKSPILEKGTTGKWDEGNVYRSCFVYHPDTDLMSVWYSSVGAGAAAGIWGIGYTDNAFTNMYYNLNY